MKNIIFYLSIYYSGPINARFPRVQVLDNWGWCSGRCDTGMNPNYTGNGCYAEISVNQNDCVQTQNKAWVLYNGSVIVE